MLIGNTNRGSGVSVIGVDEVVIGVVVTVGVVVVTCRRTRAGRGALQRWLSRLAFPDDALAAFLQTVALSALNCRRGSTVMIYSILEFPENVITLLLFHWRMYVTGQTPYHLFF